MEDQTFDYGLAPGESFDPDDEIEVDRSVPHIMTVLGPIHPGALGPVNLAASFVPRDPGADIAELLNEIQESAVVGLNGLVDLRPIASGHDARAALWLAERCNLHLVVATGVDSGAGTAANVNRIVEEAAAGMFGTRLSPGLIVTTAKEHAIRIGNAASESTGLPLVVDARQAASIPELEHVNSVLCIRAAQRGPAEGRLLIDLAPEHGPPESSAWMSSLLTNPKVLVGYDPAGRGESLFSRWNWLIEQFPIALLDAGFDSWQARALLVDDPAEFLTITLPAAPRC